MKVLLFSKYPRMGASSRLRSLQYLPFLEAQGVDVTVSNLFDEQYLARLYSTGGRSVWQTLMCYLSRLRALLTCGRYDVIWIEYELFPYFPALFERFLRMLGKPYVVDYDDAIFHNYDLSKNALMRRFLGRKIDVVMRNAQCVIAGNRYLAMRAENANARCVRQVPTVVDHLRYPPRAPSVGQQAVIGWVGSPSTQRYVVAMGNALAAVCKAHNAKLVLVGATAGVVGQLPDMPVEVVTWSEATEAELIRTMDIGIMPLQDGAWEKGKCGYKLIQYMACGVPVVASPVGVNVDIVTNSGCGLLADTTVDWQSALARLLASPEQRLQMGNAGRAAVEQTYSLQVQAPILAQIFQQAAGQGR
jgi:glycosyltransferase involved in cell wall biosynthesis